MKKKLHELVLDQKKRGGTAKKAREEAKVIDQKTPKNAKINFLRERSASPTRKEKVHSEERQLRNWLPGGSTRSEVIGLRRSVKESALDRASGNRRRNLGPVSRRGARERRKKGKGRQDRS